MESPDTGGAEMDSSEMNSPDARSSTPAPIACTLTTKAAATRVLEWADLQGRATEVVRLATGARMYFDPELETQVADLAQRERTCCVFLTLTTEIVDNRLALEVTTENTDGLPVIARLAGIAL